MLSEYGGYTIERLENELSWEQVFLMTDAMVDRHNPGDNSGSSSGSGSGRPRKPNTRVREYTLEEVISGKAPKGLAGLAIKVDKEGSE